jgi:hypothetical protein
VAQSGHNISQVSTNDIHPPSRTYPSFTKCQNQRDHTFIRLFVPVPTVPLPAMITYTTVQLALCKPRIQVVQGRMNAIECTDLLSNLDPWAKVQDTTATTTTTNKMRSVHPGNPGGVKWWTVAPAIPNFEEHGGSVSTISRTVSPL